MLFSYRFQFCRTAKLQVSHWIFATDNTLVAIRENQPPISTTVLNALRLKIMLWSGSILGSALFEYCIICKGAWIFLLRHYLMSLSRKLYFPKSLSFGAIRWSFLALASFIKRNSLRSLHSFSSCSPCASLHNSSSVHVPLRNLKQDFYTIKIKILAFRTKSDMSNKTYLSQTLKVPVGNLYCQQFWSSSELKTRSLCFSEVMCCCHCFSLLQFLPHSQQWLPACNNQHRYRNSLMSTFQMSQILFHI